MAGRSEPLTERQKLFVEEYLVDRNKKAAAIRAGYSPNHASVTSAKLIKKPFVKEMLEAATAAKIKRINVAVDDVIDELKRIAFADIKDHLSWGTLKTQIGTDEDGKPVFGYKQVVDMLDSQKVDGRTVQSVSISPNGTLRVVLYDKLEALDKLSRHLGAYQDKPAVACAIQVVFENFPPGDGASLEPRAED